MDNDRSAKVREEKENRQDMNSTYCARDSCLDARGERLLADRLKTELDTEELTYRRTGMKTGQENNHQRTSQLRR